MTEDEFTIPRPRWILPAAIAGALFLALGIGLGARLAGDDEPPVLRITGATTTVAPDLTTTAAPPTSTTAPPPTTTSR